MMRSLFLWSDGASWPCAGAQATLPPLSPCWMTLASWCVLPELATALDVLPCNLLSCA